MIALPFLFTIGTAISLFLKGSGLRDSITRSYLVVFLFIVASTECLSFFGAVTSDAIHLIWAVVTLASLAFMSFLLLHADRRATIEGRLGIFTEYGWYEAFFLLMISCILVATLTVALVYPPNNWDSMTYHMARVSYWIQNGSIDVYPTANDRQTHNPPLAEWAILHFQLLGHSDRFANIIQWISFIVSIVVSTLIAKEFQVSLRAQWLTAVVAATVPTAILESSSTQNDLVVTSFCMSFAYFLIRFTRTLSAPDAVYCSLSLGLALLTKGTAYIYCCAIGLTIGLTALVMTSQPRRLALLNRLALIVIAALLLNVGHFSRTYLVYGLKPTSQTPLLNDEISPMIIYSNLVRNAALHIGTPIDAVNTYSFRAIAFLLGNQANDPRSTLQTTAFSIPAFSLHEDYAGNLLHLGLIVLAFLALPFVAISNKTTVYCYAASLLCGVVLHCILLKWQPWATRYHTTVFMLSAPFIAVVCSGIRSIQKQLFVGLACGLFAGGVPFVISNQTRSFVELTNNSIFSPGGQLESYFVNRPNISADYKAAANLIVQEGVGDVGLCLGYDDYEYPLFVLVGRHASAGAPRFRHVGVLDRSQIKDNPHLAPPAFVLATKRLDEDKVHGKGRQVVDPCLAADHVLIFDAPTVRIWRRRSL